MKKLDLVQATRSDSNSGQLFKSIKLEELKDHIVRQDFHVLQINHDFDTEKFRRLTLDVLKSTPPIIKDGYHGYQGLGLQYADEQNPFYDAVEQIVFISTDGTLKRKRATSQFNERNIYGEKFIEFFEFFSPVCRLSRGRILIAQPGFKMAEHTDGPFCVTLHFPVVTHERCLIVVEGKSYHLPADGHFYVVNAAKPHYAVNHSDIERVHVTFVLYPVHFGSWSRKQFIQLGEFFEKFEVVDRERFPEMKIERGDE